eukprot:359351-Chlamydomonas_euryale.AAC.2
MSSLIHIDLSNSHLDAGPPTRKPVEWTLAAAQAIGGVLKVWGTVKWVRDAWGGVCARGGAGNWWHAQGVG